MAYQTVVKIRVHAPVVAIMKPAMTAQRGWIPVSAGTRNCMPMIRAAPTATTAAASRRCSMPSTSTASDAETR